MESFELQDELTALAHDVHTYAIDNEHDFSSEDPARFLEAAVEAVANNTDAIRDPEVFDVFRSVLKYSSSISGTLMNKVLDSLTSGIQSEIDATVRDIESGEQATDSSHRIPLELFGFLLQWFVTAAEHIQGSDNAPAAPAPKARRGRGGKAAGAKAAKAAAARMEETWSWQDQIPAVLTVISKVLVKLGMHWQKVWQTTTERETFVSCLVKPAYYVLENEQYMKDEKIRLGAEKVICVSVKHHNQILVAHTNIIQNLQFYEHLPEILAECLHILAAQYAHTQLGDDILREVASISFNAQDNKGPRNFARFLVKFAEYAPRSLLKQLSLLLNQLDSEAYPMRIAIVEVIGHIIQELARNLDSDTNSKQTQKQINGLFDLLHERILDTSSYVRTKVLSVLSKVFDIKVPKFPKQRLASTRAAANALEDKASTVRKAAVSLLIKLLVTHPYGMMHGGMLQHEIWNSEYDAVRKELDKVEGKVGKAVEVQNEEEEEGDNEDEGNEGEEHVGKKKTRSKKHRANDEDAMDVDDDDDGAATEEDNDEATDEDEDDAMSVESEGNPRKKAKKSKLKPRKSQLNMEALSQEQAAVAALESDDILRLRLKRKYYAEALSFIRLIENSMEKLVQLLGSTNKAEVLETMEFFRIAHGYELEGAKEGIQKMLHLIWVKDNSALTSEDGKELKGIRQRLIEVYCSLYFEADPELGGDAKSQINRIAKNMIERTFDCTLADITSLEEMMRIMMEEDRVHPDVIAKLWQIYGSNRHIPPVQRRAAIMVLGMMAIAKKSILEDHVELMLKVGLGKLGRLDLELARYTCIALQRLNGSAKKVKGSLKDNTVRYPMTSSIFSALEKAVERPCRSLDWFGLAEHAVNTVYALGQHPDKWCGDLIKKLAARAFGPKEIREEATDKEREDDDEEKEEGDDDDEGEKKRGEMDEDGDVSMTQADMSFTQPALTQNAGGEKRTADNFEMSQLFFVIGHVALKQIVFLELVEREWKRQKDEKFAAEKQASGAQSAKDKDGEELDQVAGNAEDEIGDRIQAVREHEILYGEESLLAAYAQMIVRVCGSPQIFKDSVLRRTAIISFSKLLCVSSKFCEDHIDLLFKLLEKSKDSTVRGNIAIALGDIAVSFASIVDENSSQMYKGLSDGVIQVKKNTLMVLTHLILNGMVKVKGQLGEMAKCLEDDDARIQDLSKLFFKELSGKENAIYNNLPDVISHLSTGEHAVSEHMFQNTLRYIFTFIDKERQAENIVEKLCGRFRFTEDPRQWRDIAFCLSLLPFKSERSVKRLIEGLQFYRDKLHEPAVFDKFSEILNKARSNKSKDKPDTELDEFEKILEDHRNQGQEDQAFENMVEKRKVAARKKANKKASSKRRRQTIPVEADEDE